MVENNNIHIPFFLLNEETAAEHFLNRATVLYGKTASGKTTIIKDILYCIRDKVDFAYVISLTAKINHAYDDIVQNQFIFTNAFDDNGEFILDAVFEWQSARAGIYTIANSIEVLAKTFEYCPTKAIKAKINEVISKRESTINAMKTSPEFKADDIIQIREKFNDTLVKLYKLNILSNLDKYSEIIDKMDDNCKFAVKWVDTPQPRLCIVLDDCAAEKEKLKKSQTLQKIFYNGRHSFITLIFSCQDDTDLHASWRKNSHINIYCKAEVLSTNIERKSNGYGKELIKRLHKIASHVFVDNRKLLHIIGLGDDGFRAYTANVRVDFRVGKPELWNYCDQIRSDAPQLDRNNRFIRMFR